MSHSSFASRIAADCSVLPDQQFRQKDQEGMIFQDILNAYQESEQVLGFDYQ